MNHHRFLKATAKVDNLFNFANKSSKNLKKILLIPVTGALFLI
jgi:hypothetical protein